MNLTQKIKIKKVSKVLVPNSLGIPTLYFLILDDKNKLYQFESKVDEEGFLDYTSQILSFIEEGTEIRVLLIKKKKDKVWLFKIIKIVENDENLKDIDNLLNF